MACGLTSARAGAFELDWGPAPEALRYAVYWRNVNSVNWIRHGYTLSNSYVIETSVPGTYEVHVRSINNRGMMSIMGDSEFFTVKGAARRVRTVIEETKDDGVTWTVVAETESAIPKP